MISKLGLAIAVISLVLLAASCKAAKFVMSGGDIQWFDVNITVSDETPQPGQEIRVRASSKYSSSAEREASFLWPPLPPTRFTYTATAGQFRRASGELNDPGAVYEGQQISAGDLVYWRAPDEPGKVVLEASAGDGKGSIKVMVQEQ